MNSLYLRRLEFFGKKENFQLLNGSLHGIERESLRVDANSFLATTPHSTRLGSALTHPHITTDYSEALVEIITSAEHDVVKMLDHLDALHRFVSTNIGSEMLWSHSMPCLLPTEEDIPIAWYGTSHIGMLKHVYRRGLALRYGKAMQCIAGIHFNFSLAETLWHRLQIEEGQPGSHKRFQSESYVALIRNFRRYGWLLMYLFGASPAVADSFHIRQNFPIERLSDDTLYLPYATSLRMSDIGYQNDAQSGLSPDYNNLDKYISSLAAAMNQAYVPYVKMGTKQDGEWVQINTNRLQIENEYYSAIRPKRITESGERPLHALAKRGVQYVEVRCMDIDPFEPLGINLETCHFLDAFLHFCAFQDSPLTQGAEGEENSLNFSRIVKEGRRPGLMLSRRGSEVSVKDWGLAILDQVSEVASLLDSGRDDGAYHKSLIAQREKLLDIDKTPSARVLAALRKHDNSFVQFSTQQSIAHAEHFRSRPLSARELASLHQQATESLLKQENIERTQSGDFEQFVAQYQAGTPRNVEFEQGEELLQAVR